MVSRGQEIHPTLGPQALTASTAAAVVQCSSCEVLQLLASCQDDKDFEWSYAYHNTQVRESLMELLESGKESLF